MKNKKIIFSILILILLIGLIGVTYAAFTYSRIGTTNSKQIVGDIYMHYRENNVLTLENAMPSSTYDSSKYFEFRVDGKNTYTKKDIYYEIDLTHGDNPNIEGRTIRLNDKFLKFRLVEVINNEEVEIFTNKSYNDLTNKRIHVETIPKNTTSEITKTYRIYMWIDNNLKIGNDNADYSVEDWNKIYASIKVNVIGDFKEKYTTTPPYCFTTSDNGDGTVTVTGFIRDTYELNENMSEEEMQKCINHVQSSYIGSTIGSAGSQQLCNGQSYVIYGTPRTFNDYIDIFNKQYLLENNIINIVTSLPDDCKGIVDLSIPSTINRNSVTIIGQSAFEDNQLTSVVIPNSVTIIGQSAFAANQLTSVSIPNSVTTIESEAFNWNQLTSVSIPNSVTTIGENTFKNNQLTSVDIPDSVTTIGAFAFFQNQLTSIDIPNSVETIGLFAFAYNQLTSVEIPNSVTTIGESAFSKSNSTIPLNGVTYYDNPNLTSITIDKSCNDIKNNLLSGDTNYYPWLSDSSPYTGIGGVTIYGSNNEVCDTF